MADRPSSFQGLATRVSVAMLAVCTGIVILTLTTHMAGDVEGVALALAGGFMVPSTIVLGRATISFWFKERDPDPPPPPPPPCRVLDSREVAAKEIIAAIVKQLEDGTGQLITCGVSLRDLLHSGRWRYQKKDLLFIIKSRLHSSSNTVNWDALILCPACDEAARRAAMEKTDDTIREINTSRLNFLGHFGGSPNAKVWAYKSRPFAFAVVTNSVAFVQRYPIVPPTLDSEGCFGDLDPLLVYPCTDARYVQVKAELLHMRNCECVECRQCPQHLPQQECKPAL